MPPKPHGLAGERRAHKDPSRVQYHGNWPWDDKHMTGRKNGMRFGVPAAGTPHGTV